MAPRLTDEMREALKRRPDGPVSVEDEKTRKLYILIPEDELRRLLDEQLRRELQIGFDQADRGELVDWNPEKLKAEGRARLQQGSKAA